MQVYIGKIINVVGVGKGTIKEIHQGDGYLTVFVTIEETGKSDWYHVCPECITERLVQ